MGAVQPMRQPRILAAKRCPKPAHVSQILAAKRCPKPAHVSQIFAATRCPFQGKRHEVPKGSPEWNLEQERKERAD